QNVVFSSDMITSLFRCRIKPCYGLRRCLHPFPTRRSSDLQSNGGLFVLPHHQKILTPLRAEADRRRILDRDRFAQPRDLLQLRRDRKSTRLNSSHVSISYAVFYLKKKTQIEPAPKFFRAEE